MNVNDYGPPALHARRDDVQKKAILRLVFQKHVGRLDSPAHIRANYAGSGREKPWGLSRVALYAPRPGLGAFADTGPFRRLRRRHEASRSIDRPAIGNGLEHRHTQRRNAAKFSILRLDYYGRRRRIGAQCAPCGHAGHRRAAIFQGILEQITSIQWFHTHPLPHFTSKLPLSRICCEELPTITLNVPGSTRRTMLWS